jgi:alkaline phosphatase D
LGDVAYLDFLGYIDVSSFNHTFQLTKTLDDYQVLRSSTPIVGIWDDHDYGKNNEGINFEHKNTTRELWLDFIDEPLDSERRV